MKPNSISAKPWGADLQPFPILATAVVPWTEKLEFDEEKFRREVQAIALGLTPHIYVFGTAGEGYAVSGSQFDQIAAALWKCKSDFGVRPMLGVISLSLSTIIERIERGRALGFREFQISLPSWGALNDRELARFFAETCGRFPDCHFLHYNLARSRRLLIAAEYRRLSDVHPNLVAVKTSIADPGQIRDFLTTVPGIKFFLTEFGYIEGRKLAPCGLLISLASVNYALAREFVQGNDAFRALAEADLKVMMAALMAVSKEKFHMDGSYDKMLFRVSHPWFPLRMLSPYECAPEEAFQKFISALPARWKPA